MTDTPQVCKHGSLRRVCETCDLAEDVVRLERELAAMELRAMDCVQINERQAVNFAKCQAELTRVNGYDRYCDGEIKRLERELAEVRKDAEVAKDILTAYKVALRQIAIQDPTAEFAAQIARQALAKGMT